MKAVANKTPCALSYLTSTDNTSHSKLFEILVMYDKTLTQCRNGKHYKCMTELYG